MKYLALFSMLLVAAVSVPKTDMTFEPPPPPPPTPIPTSTLQEGAQIYCYGLTMEVYGTGKNAVIWVQGGAWTGGNRHIGLAYKGLVDLGFTLVLIELEPGGPAQFRDLNCAIDYLLERGIQRIGVVGKSSGGQVAAMAGLLYKVDAAVVISAPLDFTVGCKENHASSFGFSCGSDGLLQYSPTHRVTSKWHPTFLVIHGLQDGVVSPKHSRRFVNKMDEVGAKAILRLYAGDHGGLYVEDVLTFFGNVFG